MSIGARYQVADGHIAEVPGSQTLSPLQAPPGLRAREAQESLAWYNAICADAWGRA
ncbi:FCSD flavin-binding domain-containing protein [Pseudomonas kuykendallii]|uniref:FCSD flavin-binding domain-containing protein n=1 Tax=Pseudomonas kuykendallii TaxID=1007099 RepID=UPI003C6DCF72